MLEEVKNFIEEYGLIEKGDGIILGLSGGADSVSLLLALQEIFGEEIRLLAVHVNHGIRGEEAKRDEDFVKELCKRRKIRLIVKEVNVPFLAKAEGLSLEEAGRKARYEIFRKIRKKENFQKIAVAHHKEDVAETFLINLSRGAGLRGLTGIKERNEEIIRPFLRVGREEILQFLQSRGEDFVTDSTNLGSFYVRNVIRNEVIPIMKEKVNEGFVEHISETIGFLREAYDFIKLEAEEKRTDYIREKEDEIHIPDTIRELSGALKKEILYYCLTEVSGAKKDISLKHVSKLEGLFVKEVGKKIDLPYQVEARRGYGEVILRKKKEGVVLSVLPEMETMIEEIEEIECIKIDASEIELHFRQGEVKKLSQNSCMRWFDYDRITEIPKIRTRKPGDFLVISKDGKRKKLKTYFIDEKFPREERDSCPLIASGSEILWVVGGRTGESARISLETRKLLCVKIKKMEDVENEYTD